MPLKTYLIILKTGVYLSFLSVFLVFGNLLFPFITSKQIYFNILVEILMIFWLALILKYPQARPKKSWITYSLAGFFAALLVSSIFGVDFNLSFWGDVERMLGWFPVFHFFLLYLIIITVFREPKDWRNLFIASLMSATLVCFYSLFKIPYSTIGNTTYVSGYAIMNFYFALILFFRQRDKDKNSPGGWIFSSLYLIVAFIMLSVLRETHTRGAYAGLGISLILLVFLLAFFNQNKKIKIISFSAALIFIAMVALVFSFPRSKIVENSNILSTITQISSKNATFQTRLISWKAAAKDFKNHPIFGAGYGNFAISFDKYFDPKFYSFTPTETYFDRAHNNIVDLASTSGLVGLLAYLAIFAAAGFYIIKGKKQNKISTNEVILLICLFVAYFVQNLAAFDSLVTYISLMLALGYVYWLVGEARETKLDFETKSAFSNREIGVLIMAGLVSLSLVYQYNVKPLMMLDGTISGQIKFAKGDLPGGVEEYKKALSYKTVLDRDSRASLINSVNSMQNNLMSMDGDKAKEIADYTVGLAEENVKLNSQDSMMQMQLALALNTASYLNQANTDKFYFYSDRALKAIGESIDASPGRSTIYFSRAQIYIARNDKENAIKALKDGHSLNENYAEAACFLGRAAIYFKQEKEGYAAMDKCLDLGGSGYLNPADLIKIALNHYIEKKDQPRTLILYERWAQLDPSNIKVWIDLSLLYEQAGRKDGAMGAANKAAELDVSLRPAAEEFIRKLEGK